MAELVLTLYMLGTARCWRTTKVKLKVSSSSLDRRMRKAGGPSLDGAASGSCAQGSARWWGWRAELGWAGLAYLDVLDNAIVAKVAAGGIARGGEGVGGDVQQRAVAAIGDAEGGDRDCGRRVSI